MRLRIGGCVGDHCPQANSLLILTISGCLLGAILVITKGHPEAIAALRFNSGDVWAAAGMVVFVDKRWRCVACQRASPLSQFAVMSIGASIAILPFTASQIVSTGLSICDERTFPWTAVLVLATGIGDLGYTVRLLSVAPS